MHDEVVVTSLQKGLFTAETAEHAEPTTYLSSLRGGVIPTVFVTATSPDGKPSGSIGKASFGGEKQPEGLRTMSPDVYVRAMGAGRNKRYRYYDELEIQR